VRQCDDHDCNCHLGRVPPSLHRRKLVRTANQGTSSSVTAPSSRAAFPTPPVAESDLRPLGKRPCAVIPRVANPKTHVLRSENKPFITCPGNALSGSSTPLHDIEMSSKLGHPTAVPVAAPPPPLVPTNTTSTAE